MAAARTEMQVGRTPDRRGGFRGNGSGPVSTYTEVITHFPHLDKRTSNGPSIEASPAWGTRYDSEAPLVRRSLTGETREGGFRAKDGTIVDVYADAIAGREELDARLSRGPQPVNTLNTRTEEPSRIADPYGDALRRLQADGIIPRSPTERAAAERQQSRTSGEPRSTIADHYGDALRQLQADGIIPTSPSEEAALLKQGITPPEPNRSRDTLREDLLASQREGQLIHYAELVRTKQLPLEEAALRSNIDIADLALAVFVQDEVEGRGKNSVTIGNGTGAEVTRGLIGVSEVRRVQVDTSQVYGSEARPDILTLAYTSEYPGDPKNILAAAVDAAERGIVMRTPAEWTLPEKIGDLDVIVFRAFNGGKVAVIDKVAAPKGAKKELVPTG